MPEKQSVQLEWAGEGIRFMGRGMHPVTPPIDIDSDGKTGPSPMLALLLACAGCSAVDVVEILRKMRVRLTHVSLEVEGTRRDEPPRRFTAIRYRYRLSGEGLDLANAERAVSLSLEKYCSVVHSLASDIAIEHNIEIA